MAIELKATQIYKVTSKITGEQCWYVPSNSTDGAYYKVCEAQGRWSCSCKHGQFCEARGVDPRCCHFHAVQTSILANKAQHEEQERTMDTLSEEMKQAEAAPEQRYYPSYKLGSQWYRFSERGKDVSFATETEAHNYLVGVTGVTRVEVAERERPIEERGRYDNASSRGFSLLKR